MNIGILGGGQLGQMLTLAAHPLGLKTNSLTSEADCPAGQVGAITVGDIKNFDGLRDWVLGMDVITYEFENFPAEFVAAISELRPVLPPIKAIAIAQDRWFEKQLFVDLDIPVPPFRNVQNREQLRTATEEIFGAVIAKTRTGGYDGKGQARIHNTRDIPAAEELLAQGDIIVEQCIDFDREVSIIAVRDTHDEIRYYPLVENVHRNGILHTSTVPAVASEKVEREARAAITAILRKLDYVGVLALEFFLKDDHLFANELAPRVHNSGHWTIDGAHTSQFENHLRAVAGLPLGNTDALCPTMMVNLVGTTPPTKEILAIPGARLHLYGKSARPGRKLGHVTLRAASVKELRERANVVLGLLDEASTRD